MITRYRCDASDVVTAELRLPLFRTMARSFAMWQPSFHGEQYLQHPGLASQFYRFDPLLDLHALVDQRSDVHGLLGQGLDRLLEGAAAAADYVDLVDDDGSEVEGFALGDGALEHERAARADHLEGELEAGRRREPSPACGCRA